MNYLAKTQAREIATLPSVDLEIATATGRSGAAYVSRLSASGSDGQLRVKTIEGTIEGTEQTALAAGVDYLLPTNKGNTCPRNLTIQRNLTRLRLLRRSRPRLGGKALGLGATRRCATYKPNSRPLERR
jgi:hypothetical protein